ncbi:hypothetical protein HMF8227_00858 [Saliniradius amylolyticus]|uniref:Lipoprotein n=1 Tax=Saliniradius amylolyticus TaxID=2183582 RepID=A0A2S2E155_9ALTE|nr:hypothetical protein [Saliniradius amylolyticus]AWL11353.1 hypothetical protein HMF8227_00858 [Saliniradius amylolyticus]
MERIYIAALFCVLLGGCASTSDDGETAVASNGDEELVCEYYKPTGSHVKKRFCVTKSQKEAQRIKEERDMRNLENQRTLKN